MTLTLDIPEEILSADGAIEIVGAWVVGDDVTFATRGNIWSDPAMVGIFVADLIRHLVGEDSAQIRRVLQGIGAEFDVAIS